jgi:serine/threonine protein kinase
MHHSNALPTSSCIEEYQIVSVLGSGGFGITYLATDRGLDAHVAIKEYFPATLAVRHPDQCSVSPAGGDKGVYDWGLEKFLKEAETLASLPHPHIVGVKRLLRANQTAYMVLDYIDGPNLKQWLAALDHRPNQNELDFIIGRICSALEAVHSQELLHRDISPRNIMLTNTGIPLLIDFGAVRQIVSERSQTLACLLTPGYAPFEQYVATGQGQGPWTDIYALSATIYEAIAGKPPPEAPDRALSDTCVPAVDLGSGIYRKSFLEAVDWGLRPMPKDRPQNVAEWKTKLMGLETLKPESLSSGIRKIYMALDWQRLSQLLLRSGPR